MSCISNLFLDLVWRFWVWTARIDSTVGCHDTLSFLDVRISITKRFCYRILYYYLSRNEMLRSEYSLPYRLLRKVKSEYHLGTKDFHRRRPKDPPTKRPDFLP